MALSTREMARRAIAARGRGAGPLSVAVKAMERDFAKLDRQLSQVDTSKRDAPQKLLDFALAHARLWNKHAPRLGLPLDPDPDAPEDDEP